MGMGMPLMLPPHAMVGGMMPPPMGMAGLAPMGGAPVRMPAQILCEPGSVMDPTGYVYTHKAGPQGEGLYLQGLCAGMDPQSGRLWVWEPQAPPPPPPPQQLQQASPPPPQLQQASPPPPQLQQASPPPPQLQQASPPPVQQLQAPPTPPSVQQQQQQQ